MKRKLGGVLATARQDRLSARALALADLKSFTRTCFLASAIDVGIYRQLGSPISRSELAQAVDVIHDERFDAWLELGISLKELSERKGKLAIRGRRLRSLANLDINIIGAYRSALQTEAPMYSSIVPLLTSQTDHSLTWPQTRSYTSLLANAAVAPTIREAATEAPVARFLEIGCHDGGLTPSILRSRPAMTGIAIDSDPELLALTKQGLNNRGWGKRVETRLTDIEQLERSTTGSFGLITLVNQLCLVPRDSRRAYLKHVVSLLEPGGFVVVVSLVTGGSTAAASINFALRSQKADVGLPTLEQLDELLDACELGVIHRQQILPAESLYAITAYKGWV